MCNTFGDICKNIKISGKKWQTNGHLESENDANILIRLVIPQNPPFRTGTDTLCAILWEIYVKTSKLQEQNGHRSQPFEVLELTWGLPGLASYCAQ